MDIGSASASGSIGSPNDWCCFPSPELRAILQSADRRLQSWQRPPNWSVSDWSAECRQIEDIAAYQLASALDKHGHASAARSVYNHVIASVRTCYRREWAYSLHFEPCATNLSFREQESETLADRRPVEPDPYRFLYDAMDELPADQRLLLEQLFFIGRTEAELGKMFGISQRAVSKRKQHALNALCACLREVVLLEPSLAFAGSTDYKKRLKKTASPVLKTTVG